MLGPYFEVFKHWSMVQMPGKTRSDGKRTGCPWKALRPKIFTQALYYNLFESAKLSERIAKICKSKLTQISECWYFWVVFMEIWSNNRFKSSRELFESILVEYNLGFIMWGAKTSKFYDLWNFGPCVNRWSVFVISTGSWGRYLVDLGKVPTNIKKILEYVRGPWFAISE